MAENKKLDINAAISAFNLDVNAESLDEISKMDLSHAYKNYLTCKGCTGQMPRCSVPYKSIIEVIDGQVKCKDEKCILYQAWEIMRNCGVPARYIGKRFKDFKMTSDNRKACRAALNALEKNDSLYLFGDVNTGKTMLSCIICNERAFQLKRSLFVTVTDLMDSLYNFEDQLKRFELLQRYKGVRCLVIDDLGAEYPTEFSASTLFSILDFRYKNNLQTIINSNFSLEKLANHLKGYQGDRISRRLNEQCQIVKINP